MFDEIRGLAATLTEKVFNRGNCDVSTTTSRAGFYNHERPNVLREPGMRPAVPISGNLVPASASVRHFRQVSDECAKDASRLSAWLRALQQTWPGHLEICQDADELGPSLV
jgi:hypothetical protein